jgi:hypothetical protein
MPPEGIFDILILNARPAAGKSEVIDALKNTPLAERRARFHIGEISEIDDFPMLWAWFEEDALLAGMGHPRLHTDPDGYFTHPHLWDVLIRRMVLETQKQAARLGERAPAFTTLFEFSRGSEHGGYARAYHHLPPAVLRRAAILYINVSYAESLRKNRKRFNPQRPDSILEHSLPDDKLERLYHEDDFQRLTEGQPTHLTLSGIAVPYVVMENEDDVTSARGEELKARLEDSLRLLWQRKTLSLPASRSA